MNYAIKIAYKGQNFHGWQIQDNAVSVQGELNKALEVILKHPVKSLGSGRTDTGVHAHEQYVMFESENELTSYKLLKSLNALLPDDIAVYGLYKIAENANLRFDAISRTYEYRICRRPDPFEVDYSAYWPHELNVEEMNRGAQYLLSQKDFSSFAKEGSVQQTSICDLMKAEWKEEGHKLIFEIQANRFLRNMVRAITGTLIDLGEGRIDLAELKRITESKNRSNAGRSMPAQGLFLKKVEYPKDYFQEI